MNEYDSARMADALGESHDIELTENPESADILLVNTCSIREKAEDKLFHQLGRWYKLKQKNPDLLIGVGGCVASQEGDAIWKRAPYVDMIFGPQTMHRLPKMLNEVKARKIEIEKVGKKKASHGGKSRVIDISFPEIEKFDNLPEPKASGPTAFVSIMEGCSKYCTYCVVPYTRGEEFSRPFDDVIAEVAELAEQGVREVNLLGQNVNAYRGDMHDGNVADLALLIRYVATIDGIERIRFTTSHPMEFSDSLIEVYGDVPELVSFLHLPVQHGSDRILAAMKRGHTALEYKSKIRKLRKIRPDITISSDFIVGFPGETDEDFEQLMDLIQDVGFDHSYSFIYSKRPGTPAANLHDETPNDVKKQRLSILQSRIQQQAVKISVAMEGNIECVLVEGVSKKNPNQVSGRTANNRIVNFDGDKGLIGQLVDVRITEALPFSLRAELVSDDNDNLKQISA